MRFKTVPFLLTFLLLGIGLLSQPSQAAIQVVVNETPITSFDIGQRARLITLTERRPAAAARKAAERELIEDQIKLAEAKRLDIEVSQSEIDNAYARVAQNVKLKTSQLTQVLRQGGVNPQTLKDRLKVQLTWNQVLQRRFSSRVEIDQSDLIRALQDVAEEDKNKSLEFDLKRIVVVVPKSSSKGFKSGRLRESKQIRGAFDGCDSAGNVLKDYKEVVVQTIGRRLETELPPELREEIKSTPPGKLTAPETTAVGYEMIAICGKREIASDIAKRTELESELRAKEGQSRARRYLMDLRRRATIIYP